MLIDPHTENVLQELEILHQARPAGCHTYLLVDGAFDAKWYRHIKTQSKKNWCALFGGISGSKEETLALSPLLIRYESEADSLASLIQNASGKPMLSMLVSEESLEQLQERLTPWCIVEIDGQHLNFRFADTRRLPTILEVLSEDQQAQMFGPCCKLCFVNRFGTWEELTFKATAIAPAAHPQLSHEQFAALVVDSEADEMLAALGQAVPSEATDLAPSQKYLRVKQAVVQADRYGEMQVSGRLSLCRLALGFPAWEEDPACAALARSNEPNHNKWQAIALQLQENSPT